MPIIDPKGPTDATNADNLSDRVLGELDTRRRLLRHARLVGFEKELLLLFAKYDKLMRTCINQSEREDIAKLGAVEVYKLIGGGGELYVQGELVCQDQNPNKGIIK